VKITRIETIPVVVPIQPRLMIRAAHGDHARSPFLLVKVHTNEGITGLGEVSCTPRWSGEDHFTAAHFIQAFYAPLLEGEDPTAIERLTARIASAVARNPFTKAAIEMALWDILGKSVGKPVYQLLGGAVREAVTIKWSVSGQEPAKAAEIAAWATSQGFKTIKVKVGLEPSADVARVRAVRNAVGPNVRIGVDANGGWSKATAIATIPRFYDDNIFFVEQPVPAGDVSWMADVRRQIRLPLIADESVYTSQDAMALIRADAADVFSVYVGKAGGIGPARKIVAVAEAAGIACTVGSNLEMGIGSAAMIHLAASTSGIKAEDFPCDIIGPLYYEDDLLTEPLSLAKGAAGILQRPGLGVGLDEEKVKKYQVK